MSVNVNFNFSLFGNNYVNGRSPMGPMALNPFCCGCFMPFPGVEQMLMQFQQQMLMGLLGSLMTQMNPTSFTSGQVGFGRFGSGSRVDNLLKKHGNDKNALARELGVSGRKDVDRINNAARALKATPGPVVSVGAGKPGVGNKQITVPPDVANQIARAGSHADGEKIFRGWLKGAAGTSDPRSTLNKIMGTKIKSGKEKNAGSKLMLDTMVEQSVKSIQSGRMLDICGRPTCCIPCYHCPVTMKFDDPNYTKAARQIGDLASPLTLDLDGDGKYLSDRKVEFDIDGDGELDTVNDIDEGDALLVWDRDNNGVAGEDGTELLGDNTRADFDEDGVPDEFNNGFEALEAMARKEGLIGKDDNELSRDDLDKLHRKYGLAIRRGGLNGTDQTSFSDADIEMIRVGVGAVQDEYDIEGTTNAVSRREGAEFVRTDGSTGEMVDIWYDTGKGRKKG